jgi:hypothetical protein
MPILLPTFQNVVIAAGRISAQMMLVTSTIRRRHKRYPNVNGPSFELRGGVDGQASGSPVLYTPNNNYFDNSCACGVVSLSNLPCGEIPMNQPPGADLFTLATLLFPMMGFHLPRRTDPGRPVEMKSIVELANEGTIKNGGSSPFTVRHRTDAAGERSGFHVSHPQWEALNLPDP